MPAKPHDSDKKKHRPGPKERELATQLTVAILHASQTHGTTDELSERAAGVYRRMLALVEADPETDDGA